jgi:anti-anti-sigma factor
MKPIRLTAEAADGVQVVRVEGELDTLGVDEVRRSLGRLVETGAVVLDLDRVTFIDSAGLHALFALGRSPGGGVAVAVAGTSPAARVIALVRLGDMLPVRESVEEATAALRRSPAPASTPSEGANGAPGAEHGLG